jgi:putative oxidoreductase
MNGFSAASCTLRGISRTGIAITGGPTPFRTSIERIDGSSICFVLDGRSFPCTIGPPVEPAQRNNTPLRTRTTMKNPALTTTAQTLLRVVVGFLFVTHGWQKYTEWTIPGTQAAFGDMGIPLAELAAPTVAALELAGGIALIIGFLTRPIALLLTLTMAGALILVHLPNGVFVADNGYELVLLLGAAALTVALIGPGRISIDHALFANRTSKINVLA